MVTFLPSDWNSRNQSKIITAVADLKRLVYERNLSIKKTAKFILETVAKDQAPRVTNSPLTTLDNTFSVFVNRRVLVRPKHDHYALSPAQVQHLISLRSKGAKESKTIDITSVDKAREGKEVLPEGKEVGN